MKTLQNILFLVLSIFATVWGFNGESHLHTFNFALGIGLFYYTHFSVQKSITDNCSFVDMYILSQPMNILQFVSVFVLVFKLFTVSMNKDYFAVTVIGLTTISSFVAVIIMKKD